MILHCISNNTTVLKLRATEHAVAKLCKFCCLEEAGTRTILHAQVVIIAASLTLLQLAGLLLPQALLLAHLGLGLGGATCDVMTSGGIEP